VAGRTRALRLTHFSNLSPSFEELECWHRSNSVSLRELRLTIDVDFLPSQRESCAWRGMRYGGDGRKVRVELTTNLTCLYWLAKLANTGAMA